MAETTIFSDKGYKIVKDTSGRVTVVTPEGGRSVHADADAARAYIIKLQRQAGEYGKGSFGNCFQNGRAKALADVQAKIANRLNGDESPAAQCFTNSNKPRTPRERLGFGNRVNEHVREQQSFQNAVNASRIAGQHQMGNGIARASDGLKIVGPADIRRAMENSKEARAAAHRTVIENRQSAMRRLGLTKKEREDASLKPVVGPVWSRNDDEV